MNGNFKLNAKTCNAFIGQIYDLLQHNLKLFGPHSDRKRLVLVLQ